MLKLRPWTVVVELAAADTTKAIKAAPGANKKHCITGWTYFSKTSAAQVMTIDDGTIFVGRIAASLAAGEMRYMPPIPVNTPGVEMTANAAIAINTVAGPAGTLIVHGYTKNTAGL